MTAPTRNFALELEGRILKNGWRVIRRIERAANATGGRYSKAYVVVDANGREAFLKAIDLTAALGQPEIFRELESILRAYRYERDLVARCASARTDRVVRVWDSGELELESGNPFSLVPYLIFEMADGDMHAFVDFSTGIDVAWTVRTLHEVSVGLSQLHALQIAHQDVKPSNVVMFPDHGSKVGDLGRASSRGHPIDHDAEDRAGDKKYSPPELVYGFGGMDWTGRRFGCDAYMFGALAIFMFSGMCIAVELQQRLPDPLRHERFTGTYVDLLPFLQQATNELLLDVERQIPEEIREMMGGMMRSLCEPNPTERGHPVQRRLRLANPFDLHRYTTELDIMSRKAEAAVIRGRFSA
jgi:serine/threonine protein kinase